MLIDAEWEGTPRKLMLHADRNGFFYVFDRVTGERLLSTPFVKNLTWASGIGADGRPIRLPNQNPSPQGTRVCPSQDGATNWFAPSFSPQTGLYYVQTFEKCSVYTTTPQGPWQAGKPYLGGSQRILQEDPTPQRILRALDIRTGKATWELPQKGPAHVVGRHAGDGERARHRRRGRRRAAWPSTRRAARRCGRSRPTRRGGRRR